MWCDVVGILCRPKLCAYRVKCEPHRLDYAKAESMTDAEEKSKAHERIRQSKARSLGYENANCVPARLINLVNL